MQITSLLLTNHWGWLEHLDLSTKGQIFAFVSFCMSFFFASYVLPRILIISQKKRLYDSLDSRKCHSGAVPRLGGLVFVPGIVCSLCFLMAIRYVIGFPVSSLLATDILEEFMLLLSGVTFLYLVGAKDDLVGVRYRKKFIAQFGVAALIPLSGLYFNQFYGFLGIYEIPFWIGMPLTVFIIVFITNATNLIDGIDGLAAGGCAMTFLLFGILFMYRELYLQSMLAFSALGCLLPFSYYNIFGLAKEGNKLFMGDTGSLTLGYLIAYLAVKYAMYNPAYYMNYNVNSFLIPISLLFIPCFDAVRVMVVRVIQGKSMFLADRNHIHHLCLSAGMTHREATGFLLLCNVVFIILNIVWIDYVNINILIPLDMLLYLGMVRWLEKNSVAANRKVKSVSDNVAA